MDIGRRYAPPQSMNTNKLQSELKPYRRYLGLVVICLELVALMMILVRASRTVKSALVMLGG